ncbi:hypothetical protein AMECASPLE_021325 [Ameca splendens]|uniref:Uncharacterized protein n=1 Tax=Ameca splendens TaxID=208324 RepID=A0ABV0XGJ0_9TELE
MPAMRTKLLLCLYRDRIAPNKGPLTPYFLSVCHGTTRDMVKCLFQVPKTHLDWLCKLPRNLKHPVEGVELVQCSTARTKTTLLFLKKVRLSVRFSLSAEVNPNKHSGIGLPREAEESDPPVVRTHPPVPLLMKGDHYTSVCQSRGTVPDCHAMLNRCVSHNSPTTP